MFLRAWNQALNYYTIGLSFCQIIAAGYNAEPDLHHVKALIILALHHKKTLGVTVEMHWLLQGQSH